MNLTSEEIIKDLDETFSLTNSPDLALANSSATKLVKILTWFMQNGWVEA